MKCYPCAQGKWGGEICDKRSEIVFDELAPRSGRRNAGQLEDPLLHRDAYQPRILRIGVIDKVGLGKGDFRFPLFRHLRIGSTPRIGDRDFIRDIAEVVGRIAHLVRDPRIGWIALVMMHNALGRRGQEDAM